MWAPSLPVTPSLRPDPHHCVAAPMQRALSALLRWVLGVPADTHLKLVHILGNQPPVGTLIAKQVTRYARQLEEVVEHSTTMVDLKRHANRVWNAILAHESSQASPLPCAPLFWRSMIAACGSEVPTI